MTKVHCILVTPIKKQKKQKKGFFSHFYSPQCKAEILHCTTKKELQKASSTFVITRKRQMNSCTSPLFNSILLFHIEPDFIS